MIRVRPLSAPVACALLLPSLALAEPAASNEADAGDPSGQTTDTIPANLSLADSERLFLQRGLDLLIAEAGARGAEGDLEAAGAHPNPGLSLGTTFTPASSHDVLYSVGGNVPQNLWGFSVGLTDNASIEDALSGKHSLRIEAASRALAAARLTVDDTKRVELSQLRQAYVAAVMSKLNLDAARESFTTYDDQLKLNQTRYQHGQINGLDLARVMQAQLEALQAVDQAEAGLEQAMASLLFLLGVRGDVPAVTLTTAIDYTSLDALKGASAASLLDLARQNRTDLRVAEANLQQAQAVVRQARLARLPDIQVSAGYSEQCSSQSCSSEPGINLGLQGNLPVLYQQQGEIQRAQANAQSAERTVDKARAQVLSDVTQAFAGYRAALSQVDRMQKQLLDQAKASRDLARFMYQKGAASLIDFLDAERAWVASELEYHQDLANYWASIAQLEQATGRDFQR